MKSYPYQPNDVAHLLNEKQIPFDWHTHPELHTVDDAQRLRGHLGGGSVKNLFLKDRDQHFYLIVCSSHRQFDLKVFRHHIQCRRLSFASPDELWMYLGVRPGSLSPFALYNASQLKKETDFPPFRFFVDVNLLAYKLNNFHPLHNTYTCQIAPKHWLSLIEEWGFFSEGLLFEAPNQFSEERLDFSEDLSSEEYAHWVGKSLILKPLNKA